jgi:hypothetical protein
MSESEKIVTYTSATGQERVIVSYDNDPPDPREGETVGTMACAHKRYDLGDKDTALNIEREGSWKACEAWLQQNALAWLPLSLYDHGEITMSAGTDEGWDSGRVGYIYASKADFKQAGLDSENLGDFQRVEETLYLEVEDYDLYLRNEAWSWIHEKRSACDTCGNEKWEVIESCGGYLGSFQAWDHPIEADFNFETSTEIWA